MTNQKGQIRFSLLFLAIVAGLALSTGCSSLPGPLPRSTVTPTNTPPPTQTSTVTPTATPTPFGGGGQLVFMGEPSPDNREVYVMNVDGSGLARLTNDPASDTGPVWSPNGTKIAFISDRSSKPSMYDIYVMNADGTGVTNLTQSLAARDTSPTWSPDGSRIAFVSGRNSSAPMDIYVMNSDGTGLTKLTKQSGNIYRVDWSPDGAKLVYDYGGLDHMNHEDHDDIYVMNVDGSGVTRLTNDPPDDIMPQWSSDGTKISFVSNKSEDRDSSGSYHRYNYIMNSDGSDVRVLLKGAGAGGEGGSWSPDGTKIALGAGVYRTPVIYILNTDFTCCIQSVSLPREFVLAGGIDWLAP